MILNDTVSQSKLSVVLPFQSLRAGVVIDIATLYPAAVKDPYFTLSSSAVGEVVTALSVCWKSCSD